ncbi:MAG: VOC family protein [Proteobacteria bacterium]|nr:VOC family protein [Pseudomonadota bacterium]
MRLTRIHQVAAHLEDVDKTVAFYKDTLGARFISTFDPPGLVFFDFNGTRIMLERNVAKATIYFRVDDIERAHAELSEAGVVFTDEPHLIHTDVEGVFDNPGTSEWMSFFSDPSGNTLAIASRR